MEVIEKIASDIFSMLFEAASGILTHGFSFLYKFLNIILWAMVGAVILPMVFVAGNLYPMWEKWGEELQK